MDPGRCVAVEVIYLNGSYDTHAVKVLLWRPLRAWHIQDQVLTAYALPPRYISWERLCETNISVMLYSHLDAAIVLQHPQSMASIHYTNIKVVKDASDEEIEPDEDDAEEEEEEEKQSDDEANLVQE